MTDEALREDLCGALLAAETRHAEALELQSRQAIDASFVEELGAQLDRSCLRLDVDAIADLPTSTRFLPPL